MTATEQREAFGNRDAFLREEKAKQAAKEISKIAKRESKRQKEIRKPGPVTIVKMK